MRMPGVVAGVVVPGAKLGRRLGFPTANLECPAQALPDFGVYAAEVDILEGDEPPAAAASR
jgi:riboflavin kinase/FMN adenylyltransferase